MNRHMRFIVFFVLLGSWSVMWWWTYAFHIKDCSSLVRGFDGRQLSIADATYPVGFIWGEGSPVVANEFSEWIDSVASSVREDEILSITGLAYRDEVTGLDVEHLARIRGRAIARLFDEKLPRAQLTFDGRIGVIGSDIKMKVFEGFELHKLTRNATIYESETCTLIHYPYDSLSRDRTEAMDRFLGDLGTDLRLTKGTVDISPAFPESAEKETEKQLMNWRLNDLRSRVLVESDSTARVYLHDTVESQIESCMPEGRNVDQSWFVLTKRK
jgi:hypothetical protein